MIGNSLASLHGVEQPASQQTPGPPRFKLWSEVMNGSDILVFCGFGVISNVTEDNEYIGDSDLTTTKRSTFFIITLGGVGESWFQWSKESFYFSPVKLSFEEKNQGTN